jgi:hypothetical protein
VQRDVRQPQQYVYDQGPGRGRGRNKASNDDGPRGNAYGVRGIWQGEFRGVRDPYKQDRKAQKQYEKQLRNSQNRYYYQDPIVSFIPQYREYRTRVYNYSPSYNQPVYTYGQSYGYTPYYSQPYYSQPSTRDSIVRTILSAFFGQDQGYDNGQYAPSYAPYSSYSPAYYGGYQRSYYSTTSYAPYYSQASYSSDYDQGYGGYGSPLLGSGLFGDSGFKSGLLNVGLQLLTGFMGQGYEQGLSQGQYARDNYGTRSNNYYDPYAMPEPAYYSPYASSFADQRQILEEGYRMGYQDALADRDPYGSGDGNTQSDLVSLFLSNILDNRI